MPPQAASRSRPASHEPAAPRSGESATALANQKAAKTTWTGKNLRAQRVIASHVAEAELGHLEWVTRRPPLRMLDTGYWRRRVLAVKGGFELTEQQVMQLEKILQRLGQPVA